MKKSIATRQNILQKAFALIYTQGYQTTSVDEIIATTQVTKGAFYYHFKTKDEMGLAILNELMIPNFQKTFIEPFESEDHPFDIIYNQMEYLLIETDDLKVEYGCPASNFTQEMAPWHLDFTKSLNQLTIQWEEAIKGCINKGKINGSVRDEINADEVAISIMSGYWGIRNLGKLKNSKSVYVTYLEGLKTYFNTLK